MHDCENKSTPAWIELALAWTEGHLRGQGDTCVDRGTLAWTDGHEHLTCVLEVNDRVSCD
jgi:hypothetical protein